MQRLLVFGMFIYLFCACATMPPPVTSSPTPAVSAAVETAPAALRNLGRESPATALPQLVALERQASIAQDLPLLAQLWAEDGQIVDGRGTQIPDDDYHWVGRAAILDRYVVAVFANPPPPLTQLDDWQIEVTGAQATARRGEDQWRFVKREGRWWLSALQYSTPSHHS